MLTDPAGPRPADHVNHLARRDGTLRRFAPRASGWLGALHGLRRLGRLGLVRSRNRVWLGLLLPASAQNAAEDITQASLSLAARAGSATQNAAKDAAQIDPARPAAGGLPARKRGAGRYPAGRRQGFSSPGSMTIGARIGRSLRMRSPPTPPPRLAAPASWFATWSCWPPKTWLTDFFAVVGVYLGGVHSAVDGSRPVLRQRRFQGRRAIRSLRIVLHAGEECGDGGLHGGLRGGGIGAEQGCDLVHRDLAQELMDVSQGILLLAR